MTSSTVRGDADVEVRADGLPQRRAVLPVRPRVRVSFETLEATVRGLRTVDEHHRPVDVASPPAGGEPPIPGRR